MVISNRTDHVYKLKHGNKDVYIGTSNNVSRRATEHKKSGKVFTKVELVSKAKMIKQNAERKERSLIRGHKSIIGSLPKYNVSTTGKYQYGLTKAKKKVITQRVIEVNKFKKKVVKK